MYFLGILDATCIIFNSYLTAFFHIHGTVFCLAPDLQYISGCILVGCWFGECFGCALLAFNRCIDFISAKISAIFFDERKTYIWISLMYLYAIFAFCFVIPVILNSAAIMWTFDPFLIFPEELVPVNHNHYVSKINDYNNYILIGSMAISYTVLVIAIGVKGRGTNQSKAQAQVLTVAVLICGMNFVPGFTFLLLEAIPVNDFLLYFCLFTWQMGNGGGGLIMIIFNRSVRSEVIKIFRGPPHRVSTTDKVSFQVRHSIRVATVNNFVKGSE
uniref:G_PROTEIN_RECEP_F1_2 domain-containing protein n=1 Tax=Steinernema glaseri TaxID=37863 RepID=A0A1I7Y8Y7_9BILA